MERNHTESHARNHQHSSNRFTLIVCTLIRIKGPVFTSIQYTVQTHHISLFSLFYHVLTDVAVIV